MPQRPQTAAETRAAFLAFFEEKGHTVVPSAPLVPQDDPTLLFINAGMNPFKDVFLGTGSRPFARAADTQKCLRVSGKHNDLDEVGVDTYHHTLFEMLGNWSFGGSDAPADNPEAGPYFKREAIAWAWELLVDRWGLDPERLYVTVHEGDDALGLGPDQEAADLWTEHTTVPPAHILFAPSKDNFWMMGDTGPCGPCSEIHVDMRPDAERAIVPGQALVNQDDPRVIEIWNLVFIQYNAGKGEAGGAKGEEGTTVLTKLPAGHVDTGMGFERITAVLQGKTSNYDTDLFAPLLAAIADAAGSAPYDAHDEASADGKRTRVAMRVVADHVRTLAFAIADGASPSNTGRGYVIRRILRRAVRYGYQGLGLREPFLHALLPTLAESMGDAFPELRETLPTAQAIVKGEEEAFLRTLAGGIDFFETLAPVYESGTTDGAENLLQKAYVGKTMDEVVADVQARAAEKTVAGEVSFLLHDTYGFPSDLTAVMARERGLSVDEARFEELMTEQRERARAAAGFSVDNSAVDLWDATVDAETDDGTAIAFVGYDTLSVEGARVLKTRTRTVAGPDGEGDAARHELVLDRTPFYAESGGQVGDTGTLTVGGETVGVVDTVKDGSGTIVHVVDRLPADLSGDVSGAVDAGRRARVQRHHSATHLLHAALRETLGPHVQQKGSLVAPDRLRFDFSHTGKVTADEQATIAARVAELVLQNLPKGEERDVPLAEAKARGATALFGEKYGERVRVIAFGPNSVELCGGTHVAATGEIGPVVITSEGSVASGVRRIEAVAGEAAHAWLAERLAELDAARAAFKAAPDDLAAAIGALHDEARALRDSLAEAQAAQAAAGLDGWLADAADVDGVAVVLARVPGATADALRDLAETAAARLAGAAGVAVFGTDAGGKALLAASATPEAIQRGAQAGRLVGALAKQLGGGGGGRPNLATAGGRDASALDSVLASAPDAVRDAIG